MRGVIVIPIMRICLYEAMPELQQTSNESECNSKVIEAVRAFSRPISEIKAPFTRPLSSILPKQDEEDES